MPRRYLFFLLLLILTPASVRALENNFYSGMTYSFWSSDGSDKGSQLYVPIKLETQYECLSIGLETAGIYAQADSSISGEQSFAHFIDTKLHLSCEQKIPWKLHFLAGLDLNLPTGKTGMSPNGLELLQDSDLNDVNSYGEGFGATGTLNLVREWHNFAAGIGAGYAWKGEYDYSSETKDYDPGDSINLTSEMIYKLNRLWRLNAFGEYSLYGKDQLDSEDSYQKGDYLLLGAGVRYTPPKWNLETTLQHIIRQKGKIYSDSGSGLIDENHNSNGNEWIVTIDYRYKWRSQSAFFVGGEFLTVSKNSYYEESPYFVDQRQKFSTKVGFSQTFFKKLNANVYLKGFILDVGKTLYQTEDRSYRGLSLGFDVGMPF